jgi:hypothetical protein
MTFKTCLPFGGSHQNFVRISLPPCACYVPGISKKNLRLLRSRHIKEEFAPATFPAYQRKICACYVPGISKKNLMI